MRLTGFSATLAGSALTLALVLTSHTASARSHRSTAHHHASYARVHGAAAPRHHIRYASYAGPVPAHVIQCVTFARSDAGIDLSGNARDWWPNAAGLYARGARPEAGSVLSFKANGRMPLGHVAVVSGVSDSRTIVIDQSHWGSAGISRDIVVKDVSEDNDWTAVRVQLGHREAFGSIYPTHGFIYPRPDRGVLLANNGRTPRADIGPAPADLRRDDTRGRADVVEVAEAPDRTRRPIDISTPGVEAVGVEQYLRR